MSFKDTLNALLAGGLPLVLDGVQSTAQGDNKPEQIAPVGTAANREATLKAQAAVAQVQWKQVALIVGGVVLAGGVLFIGIKAASRRG